MAKQLTPDVRRALAVLAGINEQYLYQCLTGRREMGAEEAVRVEAATNARLRRWDLCQKSWYRIWPELIGTEGAPQVPEKKQSNGARMGGGAATA